VSRLIGPGREAATTTGPGLHRQQRRALGDEVGLASGCEVIDHPCGVAANLGADQGDLLGGKRGGQQPAHLGVPRRAHRDETLTGRRAVPEASTPLTITRHFPGRVIRRRPPPGPLAARLRGCAAILSVRYSTCASIVRRLSGVSSPRPRAVVA
jgi:hypothetical protein